MSLTLPSSRNFDIVGIGRNSWDQIALVDTYPPPNVKVEIAHMEVQAGGQVATTLVAAARLGAKTKYLGKFGDDAAGRGVRNALSREGIDLTDSKVVPQTNNQSSFIVVDAHQRTRNVFGHSENRLRITSDDFSQEAVAAGRIVYLGARHPMDVLPYAKIGKASGSVIVADIDSANDGVLELLEHVDVMLCPESIPQILSGERSLADAMAVLAKIGPRIICCTRGHDGAVAYQDGKIVSSDAIDVTVVDTTGAGDAFHGAFMVGLLDKMSTTKILQFSNAVAAMKCRNIGGQRGLPTRGQVDEFLNDSSQRPTNART